MFYDTEDQARRDGFKPCKRCKPDDKTFVGEREEVVTRVIALMRIKKDDLTMRISLKELAREVGITPSYLCRVFKKTMGVTVGVYMKELEREPGKGETESSVQSPREIGSGVVDVGTGLLMPATTARSPSAPVEGLKGGPAEDDVGNVEGDLDLDFDFDEWLWTEGFSNDSIYTGSFDLANDSLKGQSKIVPTPSITDSCHSGSTILNSDAGLRTGHIEFS